MKIAYIIEVMYNSGGMERVLSVCANSLCQDLDVNTRLCRFHYCLHMIPLVWLIKLTFQWFRPENRFQGSLFMLFIIAIEVLVMFAVISIFNKKPLKYVLGKF